MSAIILTYKGVRYHVGPYRIVRSGDLYITTGGGIGEYGDRAEEDTKRLTVVPIEEPDDRGEDMSKKATIHHEGKEYVPVNYRLVRPGDYFVNYRGEVSLAGDHSGKERLIVTLVPVDRTFSGATFRETGETRRPCYGEWYLIEPSDVDPWPVYCGYQSKGITSHKILVIV